MFALGFGPWVPSGFLFLQRMKCQFLNQIKHQNQSESKLEPITNNKQNRTNAPKMIPGNN
jgi:hypothetical protein